MANQVKTWFLTDGKLDPAKAQQLKATAQHFEADSTRKDVLPFLKNLCESIESDEDEAFVALAEELNGDFLEYVGGKPYAKELLGPLENLARAGSEMPKLNAVCSVRAKAVESLRSIAHEFSTDDDFFKNDFIPLVVNLATDKARPSAFGLLSVCYEHMDQDQKDSVLTLIFLNNDTQQRKLKDLAMIVIKENAFLTELCGSVKHDEDKVFCALAGALKEGKLLPLLGDCDHQLDHVLLLLSPLEKLAGAGTVGMPEVNSVCSVRNEAVKSLEILAKVFSKKEQHVKSSFFKDHFIPLVKKLAKVDLFGSRVSACKLFLVCFQNVSTDLEQATLLNEFCLLCREGTPEVTAVAASQLKEFVKHLKKLTVEIELVKLSEDLAKEEGKQVSAVIVAVAIASALPKDSYHLMQTISKLAHSSFSLVEVRRTIAGNLSQLPKDSIHSMEADLLIYYMALLKDSEAAVAQVAAANLKDFGKKLNEETRKDFVLECLEKDSISDAVWPVLLGSVMSLASQLGKTSVTGKLIAVLKTELEEKHPGVVCEILSNLHFIRNIIGLKKLCDELKNKVIEAVKSMAEREEDGVRLLLLLKGNLWDSGKGGKEVKDMHEGMMFPMLKEVLRVGSDDLRKKALPTLESLSNKWGKERIILLLQNSLKDNESIALLLLDYLDTLAKEANKKEKEELLSEALKMKQYTSLSIQRGLCQAVKTLCPRKAYKSKSLVVAKAKLYLENLTKDNGEVKDVAEHALSELFHEFREFQGERFDFVKDEAGTRLWLRECLSLLVVTPLLHSLSDKVIQQLVEKFKSTCSKSKTTWAQLVEFFYGNCYGQGVSKSNLEDRMKHFALRSGIDIDNQKTDNDKGGDAFIEAAMKEKAFSLLYFFVDDFPVKTEDMATDVYAADPKSCLEFLLNYKVDLPPDATETDKERRVWTFTLKCLILLRNACAHGSVVTLRNPENHDATVRKIDEVFTYFIHHSKEKWTKETEEVFKTAEIAEAALAQSTKDAWIDFVWSQFELLVEGVTHRRVRCMASKGLRLLKANLESILKELNLKKSNLKADDSKSFLDEWIKQLEENPLPGQPFHRLQLDVSKALFGKVRSARRFVDLESMGEVQWKAVGECIRKAPDEKKRELLNSLKSQLEASNPTVNGTSSAAGPKITQGSDESVSVEEEENAGSPPKMSSLLIKEIPDISRVRKLKKDDPGQTSNLDKNFSGGGQNN